MPIWRKKVNATSGSSTNGPPSRKDFEGKVGKLIVAIPEGRTGVVRLQDATGATVQETAVSMNGTEIPNGTEVLVITVRRYDVIVIPSPVQFEQEEEDKW